MIFQKLCSPDGGERTVNGQLSTIFRDVVHVSQQLVRRLGGAAFHHVLGGDFGGANPGQSAPGRNFRQQLPGSQIVALLQGPAAQTHGFLAGFDPAASRGSFALQGNFGGGGEPGAAPVEGGRSLALAALREQRQLQLLHGVAVIVTDKC